MGYKTIEPSSHRAIEPKRGFSLIEIMVVVAIMIIISVVAFLSLSGRRNVSDLNSTTEQITALLREAESRSISGVSGATWGVHIENNTSTGIYALYKDTYSPTNTVGYYRLPPDITISTASIPVGSSLEVTFAANSGIPSASASLTIILSPQNLASTITVSKPGLIAYSTTSTPASGGGGGGGGGVTIATDDFNRADNNSTLGANWEPYGGNQGGMGILSNQAELTVSGAPAGFLWLGYGVAPTSWSAKFGSNTTAGNTIIVFCRQDGSGTRLNVPTDTEGNTFQTATTTGAGTTSQSGIFYAVNIAGGTNDTVTCSDGIAATFPPLILIQEFSGVATSSALDLSSASSTSGLGSICTSQSFTPSTSGELLMFGCNNSGQWGVGGFTAGSGTTIPTGGKNFEGGLEYKLSSSSSSQTVSMTYTAGTANQYITALFKSSGAVAFQQAAQEQNLFTNDQFSKATIVGLSQLWSLLVRGDTTGLHAAYAGGIDGHNCPANDTKYRIWVEALGTPACINLATSTQSAALNDVVELDVKGTSLTLFVNGVNILNATDSTYASGLPGIFVENTTSGVKVADNWSGGNL